MFIFRSRYLNNVVQLLYWNIMRFVFLEDNEPYSKSTAPKIYKQNCLSSTFWLKRNIILAISSLYFAGWRDFDADAKSSFR